MEQHRTAVKESATLPEGLETVTIGRRHERAVGHHPYPDPLEALSALRQGQMGVLQFPLHGREDLNQWRAGLWSAANQLRRSHPERGLLCTTVREEAGGPALYFWYAPDDGAPSGSAQGVGAYLHGYSVAEAAKVLSVSEKTIRRHIKAGRLSATLFNGPRGPEYRIESLELREPAAQEGQPSSELNVGDPIEGLASMSEDGGAAATEAAQAELAVAQAELAHMQIESAQSALLVELQTQLAFKERRLEELEREKIELAGQLGAIMERARNLEEQLRLLPPPAPKKRSWWRRLFFPGS